MIFNQTKLKGAFIIEIEKKEDSRGFFARAWDVKEFEQNVSNSNLVQCNISHNNKKGTIRGMHYQIPPYSESKLIRCTKGEIFDVIIDLRENSNTRYKWISTKLDSYQHNMIYVPEGFGHGFQTLEDNTEVYYQNSQIHKSEFERGVKFDDPFFNIKWPINKPILSNKDMHGLDLLNFKEKL